MSLTEWSPVLVVATAFGAPPLTEWAKARFGRRTQRVDESNKSHDQLQEDLAAERAKNKELEMLLAASRLSEDIYRERTRTAVQENVELIKKVGALEVDLQAVLRGSLTK